MNEKNKKKASSFWKTLPGILTAVAAVITAVSGLFAVLYNISDVENSKSGEESDWIPSLVVPQDASIVSQPYIQPWRFKWDEPSTSRIVQQYHLRVFGPSAAYPLIDDKIIGIEYTRPRTCSYIIERNRLGWNWQVRAQFQDGRWGSWSKSSTFDVSPFNKLIFCQQCPDTKSCLDRTL